MQIGQGRGQTRGVSEYIIFLADCLALVPVFGEGMYLVSECMIHVLGVVRLHRCQRCNSCGHRGLASFWFSLGLLRRCGEEDRGCGSRRTHLRGERGCLPERCRTAQDGNTPLHRAAANGHAAVVEQLLAAGADKDSKSKVRQARG